MYNDYPKPRWWRLYAILPLAVALLTVDAQLALPSLGHKLFEIMIVLVTVALMGLWVWTNAAALEWSDIADDDARDVRARANRLPQRQQLDISSLRAQTAMAASVKERTN